ncbi:hypothetical protein [Polycladidibacter stylochi]|uniref:hypothetical protein n=1 Tax=Polycladidibacter stylochi TaxID=1807766 RepID=UPI00082B873B|nr:hypothetical protein [Pseudovibrio stylochi]
MAKRKTSMKTVMASLLISGCLVALPTVITGTAQAKDRLELSFSFGDHSAFRGHSNTPAYYVGNRWFKKNFRLNKRQLKQHLRSMGFHSIRRVRSRGDVYVVRAKWRRYGPVKLVIDAYSGLVLQGNYKKR